MIPYIPPADNGKGGKMDKTGRCHWQRRVANMESQKVTVRLGSVKEEKVAVASVRAKTVVLPSPGV